MAKATISVKYRGRDTTFELTNVDLGEKRDALALEVGHTIVDAIWALGEEK